MTAARTAAVAITLVATILTIAGSGAVTAVHDSPGNWTVVPGNHQPGEDGVDYKHFAVGQAAWDGTHEGLGLQQADYMVLTWDEGSFADCTLFNAEAFGFDRENDDPGTETDDFAGTYVDNFAMEENVMWLEFYDEDDAGPTTRFNRSDQFVAHQTSCYQNPDEPGWYRVFGWMNGTDYAGDFGRAELYSHYFYICDCESYDEAEENLGPPPSEVTPTPTATPTPTPTASGDGSGDETPDDDTTPTPTDDTGETATETATPTPTPQPGEQTAGSPTPTDADGPGFTAIAAIVALLGAVLVGYRRA